ncbi:MAG: response regulator [Roseinatronobacter sp.]
MPMTQTCAAPRPLAPLAYVSPQRLPMRGGTLLLVEDSRLASEAIRLMFHGAGARLRRAETLAQAGRHLNIYAPDAALIDLGLPDGCGTTLIADMTRRHPRSVLIVAMSGQPERAEEALAAGADLFLAKPIANVTQFRQVFAPVFPALRTAPCPDHAPSPGPAVLRDDLFLALDLLSGARGPGQAYALQFVSTLAGNLRDQPLADAVEVARAGGRTDLLIQVLHQRLQAQPLI